MHWVAFPRSRGGPAGKDAVQSQAQSGVFGRPEPAMAERQALAVEILTIVGWYRGHITLPVGGRLIDFLNTKPEMIALTRAVLPDGTVQAFVAINTDQVMAVRPREDES
jgi:hypothetical protein